MAKRKLKFKSLKPRVRRPKRSPKVVRNKRIPMREVLKNAQDHAAKLQARINSYELTINNMKTNYKNLHEHFEALKNPVWKTGSGRLFRMTEMEDGHLRNTISYCARRLITELSRTVWLKQVEMLIEGLANTMKEAKRRDIEV